jgi:ribosomal protein S18 acetylase RimI-like enzyme
MALDLVGAEFSPQRLPEGLTVARLDESQVDLYAPIVEGVLIEAYRRRFAQELGAVSPEDVQQQFDPDDEAHVEARAERMRSSIRSGSVYWLAHLGHFAAGQVVNGEVVGLAKTTPSRPRLKPNAPPHCYLNDVLSVREDRGVGSATVRTVLETYDDDRLAVLDTQVVNTPAQTWFEGMGFRQRGRTNEGLAIGSRTLRQVRYQAMVAEVKQAIDAKGHTGTAPPRWHRSLPQKSA